MDNTVLIIGLSILALCLIGLVFIVYKLLKPEGSSSDLKKKQYNSALSLSKAGLKESGNKSQNNLALRKRLQCAGWDMMPVTFRALQFAGAFGAAFLFFVFGFGLKILWLPFGFVTGVIIVNSFLSRAIHKRFKNFDNDYPNFLLSLCGLMRTGMNPLHAIEVAVEQLTDQSLLKQEVLMMTERLKFGVAEDIAIGSFGETIEHPEIELFVQAFLLSRRLGGTLSDTLERLAKQVRKRQFFRASALAAVSLQRGSVWAILGILVGLLGYILVVYPPLVTEGFHTPFGQVIWQVGIMMMLTGIWWVRQITNIKV